MKKAFGILMAAGLLAFGSTGAYAGEDMTQSSGIELQSEIGNDTIAPADQDDESGFYDEDTDGEDMDADTGDMDSAGDMEPQGMDAEQYDSENYDSEDYDSEDDTTGDSGDASSDQ